MKYIRIYLFLNTSQEIEFLPMEIFIDAFKSKCNTVSKNNQNKID